MAVSYTHLIAGDKLEIKDCELYINDKLQTMPENAQHRYYVTTKGAVDVYKRQKVYTAGQYPVNNLLNPIAWAQFIDAWRQGKFKKKTTKK